MRAGVRDQGQAEGVEWTWQCFTEKSEWVAGWSFSVVSDFTHPNMISQEQEKVISFQIMLSF